MNREWRQKKPKKEYDDTYSVIDKLIAVNGIEDPFRFLYPSEEELHSPYLLKNIEAARDRIVEAIELKQSIGVHLDCDNDGLNSGAVMDHYLRNFTNNVQLIYNERSIGHGIGLTMTIPKVDLLIILDSSSNDIEKCKELADQGIDIIIIDHHTVDEDNYHCILVNPQQVDCEYPNKESSGSLLTWKMCQVLDDYFHESYSDSLLEFAAFGLYGDMMSVGTENFENRYLVSTFLDNILSYGLKALIKVLNKENQKLNGTTIGYNLAPFINAATRLDRLELALNLLTSDDPEEALSLAVELKELNELRKKVQKEAVARLRQDVNEEDKCIVLIDSSLGKGYNGLVANDLAGIYQRPVIVLGVVGDELHGSFRSYAEFDFLAFLSTFEMVINTGGHPEAGGVKILANDLELFKEALNEKLEHETFEQIVEYDFELDASEINENLITKVQNFCRVSGTGFEDAKFMIRNLVVNEKKIVGSGDTLKLGCLIETDTWFMDKEDIKNTKPSFVVMKFKADEETIEGINEDDKIDVIASLNLNLWTKYKPKYEIVKTKQLFIEDYRVVKS